MQTTTKLRDTGTDVTTTAPRRRRFGATLLTAGAMSLVGVLVVAAQVTSDPRGAGSTTAPVIVEMLTPTAPPAAPFENDFSLCALGVDGIEATYTGALVRETVSRYSASCLPAQGGGPFPAPND